MSKPIIQLNEEIVKSELKELVRNSVEDTLYLCMEIHDRQQLRKRNLHEVAYPAAVVKGLRDRSRSLRCMPLMRHP